MEFRIDQPVVDRPVWSYQQVRFLPGDSVTITAGGCVQTGGHGRTWKRYVNPDFKEDNDLYYGMIWIPGVTTALQRLSAWVGRTLIIPPHFQTPQDLYLRLGYKDDDYSDNGYYSHDDGTGGQCAGLDGQPAWVKILVHHGAVSSPTAYAPYDLVSQDTDINGLPLNPLWGAQLNPDGSLNRDPDALPGLGVCSTPWKSPCTTQQPDVAPTGLNESSCYFGRGPLDGHVNWGLAAFQGTAVWDQKAFWDVDYNVNLHRSNPAASPPDPFHSDDRACYTRQNPYHLHTEFASAETIDSFGLPWWQRFHNAVDESDSSAEAMLTINGNEIEVIEIGVVGLDCAHVCASELHPVVGMALHIKDDPSDDVWVFFARNWGNEGWCSTGIMTFPELSSLGFALPWRPNAIAVSATDSNTKFQLDVRFSMPEPGPTIPELVFPLSATLFPYQHSYFAVQLALPPPTNFVEGGGWWTGIAEGELHLHWTVVGGSTTTHPAIAASHVPAGVVAPTATIHTVEVGTSEEPEPEKRAKEMVAKMPIALQNEFNALTPVKRPVKSLNVSLRILREPPANFHMLAARHAPTKLDRNSSFGRIIYMPDPQADEFQRKRIEILKKAYPALAGPSLH